MGQRREWALPWVDAACARGVGGAWAEGQRSERASEEQGQERQPRVPWSRWAIGAPRRGRTHLNHGDGGVGLRLDTEHREREHLRRAELPGWGVGWYQA